MVSKDSHTDKTDLYKLEYEKLGQRIKAFRIARGYSSAEAFANERGLPRAQYGKFEKGRNLTYLNLLRVTQALNISLREFFSEGFEDSPAQPSR